MVGQTLYVMDENGQWLPQGEIRGELGPVGPQGIQGIQGIQGNPGPQGVRGPAGAEGPRGIAGPRGPVGPTGPAGPVGQGINLMGAYNSYAEFAAAAPRGKSGDAWVVTGDLYVADSDGMFINEGRVEGRAGPQGRDGTEGPEGPRGPVGPEGPEGPDLYPKPMNPFHITRSS
ncbi:MAG: hypothetical protein FWH26_01680 [Oscillospiraceae bacterium]|nr:hypothetical protein [Oscillospiraceae bacterium]